MCVYGPDEDDEFAAFVAPAKDALEVIEAEAEAVRVEAWAATVTATAARVATLRIIVMGRSLWTRKSSSKFLIRRLGVTSR